MVLSQLKALVRPMYSSPPAHYAKVAGKILGDEALMQVRACIGGEVVHGVACWAGLSWAWHESMPVYQTRLPD